MTNYTQNGPQKKVYRWRHRAELVNQGATLVFWSFLCCLGEWLHNALCFHLEGCRQIGKLLMCAPDMLHPSSLEATYHDLPWCTDGVYKVAPGLKRQNQSIFWSCGILILSATGKKGFRCLFELLVHLDPLHRLVRTGDARHQLANENESVTCSPGPISPPLHWTLQTPSRSNGLIGEEKRLLQAPIVPKCKLRNPKFKAGVKEVRWRIEIKQPFLSLSDSQALQINGAARLLLQADTGWDRWHCG